MTRYNRSSNKVLALASAMTAISIGFTFDFWASTEAIAKARNVDAREIWQIAQFKANKKHTAPQPDPTPTTPKAQTIPTAPRPNIVKMAKVNHVRRLNSLGTSNERVYIQVA